jgi:ribosome modulation factor
MNGIERMMEQSFEAGLINSRTAEGSQNDCPYDHKVAPNLRRTWLYGWESGKQGRLCRRKLRLS